MCVRNINECYCPCHTNPDIKHVRACCRQCPKCGKRIVFGYEEHFKECKGNESVQVFLNAQRFALAKNFGGLE